MLIDFNTRQIIPEDPVITITQSLVKSVDATDKKGIDFNNPDNNIWEEVLPANGILTPEELILEFKRVLATIANGGKVDPGYCKFMYEQCSDWEVTDKFITLE